MPLISGPPKDVVFGWAHDFAQVAIEIYRLQELDEAEQQEKIDKLKAEEAPTSLPELVERAAAAVRDNRLGWYRRNQFLGGLQGFSVFFGMPAADASYLVKLVKTRLREGQAASASA